MAKIVGYQGFQSYGDLPYANLKVGKKTLDSNEVWEKSINSYYNILATRDQDKQDFYKNSNYM